MFKLRSSPEDMISNGDSSIALLFRSENSVPTSDTYRFLLSGCCFCGERCGISSEECRFEASLKFYDGDLLGC